MGVILLRSDWDTLAQAVVARNKIEGFSWKENEWEELPPHVQTAARCLGYSREVWTLGEEPPARQLEWNELNPQQQEAAEIIGFTESTWHKECNAKSPNVMKGTCDQHR